MDHFLQKIATTASLMLDLQDPQLISPSTLGQYARELNLDQTTAISFIMADLAFTATNEQGQIHICAVEIPLLTAVQQRHINRARRNAEFLNQVTKMKPHALVASPQYPEELDWRKVHWLPLNA